MKSKKIQELLNLVETSNRQKVSDLEVLEARQAMQIRGGYADSCSGCDGTGGITPPPTKPVQLEEAAD